MNKTYEIITIQGMRTTINLKDVIFVGLYDTEHMGVLVIRDFSETLKIDETEFNDLSVAWKNYLNQQP